jgi:hypothetical protein
VDAGSRKENTPKPKLARRQFLKMALAWLVFHKKRQSAIKASHKLEILRKLRCFQ